jgi:hypothetical protein
MPAAVTEMTARQVARYEQQLRERAREILRQVKDAKSRGETYPWISRESGIDMSFEYELWRRWEALCKELSKARAERVSDLGAPRVTYWEEALDPKRLTSAKPLGAFAPVEPLMRNVDVPSRRPFRRS